MNIANPRDCVIAGRAVQQVESNYLWTVMSWDGLLRAELEERLNRANQAMGMLKLSRIVITFQYPLNKNLLNSGSNYFTLRA